MPVTKIYITPPYEGEIELIVYEKCSVTMSTTDRVGSISIDSASIDDSFFDKFTVGSDIKVIQNGNLSRGWILNPPRSIDGQLNKISIEGLSYSARTQKILVTEVYENQKISDIVFDLFTKYTPTYDLTHIVVCEKTINIKFSDVFLFDAMEQLAGLAGYEWFIEEPLPEVIDMLFIPNGWHEVVVTSVHTLLIPSESLYPNILLYP